MSKESALMKNTAIVTIGKICTQMISFFLLPLYTALLSTEEYGVVDLLNTLINLIVPILLLQIDQGVFRFLIDVRGKERKENELISASIFFTIAQTIIYMIVFACMCPFIHNQYKWFLGTNLVFALFSTLLLQISRGIGDNLTYAISSFIAGSSMVLLNVVFIVFFHWGAYGMMIASMISNMLSALYIFIKLKLYNRIKLKYYQKQQLVDMIKYSIPLVPNVISWWIVASSNRVIISFFLNLSANGVFSAANKFSGVITMVYGVFNLTWTESAAININCEDKDSFFSKTYLVVLKIFGAGCLLVISLMPFVFPIMINMKFIEAYEQIPILILSTVFNILVSFLGSIYVAKKLVKEIAKTSILAAIINIIACVGLINFIGLYAASIATFLAYFILFIYRSIDSRKIVKLEVPFKFVVSMVAMYLLAMLAYYLKVTWIQVIVAIITIIYAILINLSNVKVILNIVLSKIKKA